VYLLRSGKLDAATEVRALETIERNARAEARLISDMLDVSRVVGAKIRLDRRAVDLDALVAETIETVRPAIDDGEVQVLVVPAAQPVGINGDPDRIRQVIENLLLNAIKFTPRGGRIRVCLGGDGKKATVAVCDDGQGISSAALPHIFERFRQGEATSTRMGGLGLGLAIVEHLVELHGGSIKATSDGEGEGATFVVTLPVDVPPTGADAASVLDAGDGGLS
jgi:signal transduction histidine kinase